MTLKGFKSLKWIKFREPIFKPSSKDSLSNYGTITPFIWKESSNKYYMFYTTQSYKNKEKWNIQLAMSHDLIYWEKVNKEPIINIFSQDKITSVDGVTLIFNKGCYYLFFESKIKQNRKIKFKNMIINLIPKIYKKYLIALKWNIYDRLGISMALQHAKDRKILMLISEQMFKWDINKVKVILEGDENSWDCEGVFSPRVFNFEGKFYMLYGGSNGKKVNTGIAISSDLINWNKISSEPVLTHGKKGEWDENHALIVDIVKLEDGYLGFYEGEDRKNRYRIGCAYSKDLINWEKFDNNPILDIGPKGSFDERMVCSPHVIIKEDEYYLFYSAHNRYMMGYCALAKAKYDKYD